MKGQKNPVDDSHVFCSLSSRTDICRVASSRTDLCDNVVDVTSYSALDVVEEGKERHVSRCRRRCRPDNSRCCRRCLVVSLLSRCCRCCCLVDVVPLVEIQVMLLFAARCKPLQCATANTLPIVNTHQNTLFLSTTSSASNDVTTTTSSWRSVLTPTKHIICGEKGGSQGPRMESGSFSKRMCHWRHTQKGMKHD